MSAPVSQHASKNEKAGKAVPLRVLSFGFKNGPAPADILFDVRFLQNPYWDDTLRPLSGQDAAVADKIMQDPNFTPFFSALTGLLVTTLPQYSADRTVITIALGCTGGRHRSVFVAEKLSRFLSDNGWQATAEHRDMAAWTDGPA